MQLPFTPNQFFSIFAAYNHAFWIVVIVMWFATLAILVVVWRDPARWTRLLSFLLGTLWLWNAVAYHAFLFTRINPAAWVFAAMFAVQALLLLHAGLQGSPHYLSATGARQALGLALATYSLAYPFLTMAVGHDYPYTPTFGLPCPTVILTIGLLFTTREPICLRLAVIPILWAFIGGSAATLLNVPTDYVLLAAGIVLLVAVVVRAARPYRTSCMTAGREFSAGAKQLTRRTRRSTIPRR